MITNEKEKELKEIIEDTSEFSLIESVKWKDGNLFAFLNDTELDFLRGRFCMIFGKDVIEGCKCKYDLYRDCLCVNLSEILKDSGVDLKKSVLLTRERTKNFQN